MAATRRARLVGLIITAIAVLTLAVVVVVVVGGRSGSPRANGTPGSGDGPSGSTSPPPPPICPLTGQLSKTGRIPDRPALAVKVENLPVARPQTGLSFADVIWEEPVEAYITRFIAVYQCQDASKIEPVRSARFTDADLLPQLGRPAFAYAGGVPKVREAVDAAGVIDVNYLRHPEAYHRDSNRPAPHNLYTSTRELYRAAPATDGIPTPLFTYAEHPRGGKHGTELHLPFSSDSDVFWRYDAASGRYLRWHGSVPHTYSDGTQVSSKNIVVEVVRIELTDVRDANGVASPRALSVGSGKAYVLRNGKVVVGTWERQKKGDITSFVDSKGHEIKLAPGNTWIELFPSNRTLSYS
jgi:DUF3048 family protein